jgi:hypothetical protein
MVEKEEDEEEEEEGLGHARYWMDAQRPRLNR